MKLADTRLKKGLLIFFATLLFVILNLIVFISPLAKYLIEKYDEQYTGRQIKLDLAYVNPFTGYIYLTNVRIYEDQSDTLFLTANSVSANFSLIKMFRHVYEITELTLNKPKGFIILDKRELNFKDLIKKFSKKHKPDSSPSKIHFNLTGIKINDGEFHYRELMSPVDYFIRELNVNSTGLKWDTDTIAASFSFLSGMSEGKAEGNFTINYDNLDFRLSTKIHHYDLYIIEQYLKDLINYGTFSAALDADINATGNFREAEDLKARGMISINDLHFGKTPGDDFLSFDKFILDIRELNPKDMKYNLDSAIVVHPFFKYERYDLMDNLQTMFGRKMQNISSAKSSNARFNLILEIAKYVVILGRNFLRSDYNIDKVAIYNGDFRFNDYSLSEKFSIAASPVSIVADSVNKHRKRVDLALKAGLKPFGEVAVNLSINPNDTGDFDMVYALKKLPAAWFNPYTITYTSYPLDKGTIEIKGSWTVRNSQIQSVNHVIIIDPRLARRIKNKDLSRIPLPLILAFIRERGNVIDYEIPVTGNLKSTNFHFADVFLDLIENILIKPPTLPYRTKVNTIETEIEKSLTLKWDMHQQELSHSQKTFFEKMSDYLEDHPEAALEVYPLNYAEKEKEYILFYEAKKKYFLTVNKKNEKAFNSDDSDIVNKMSVKDSDFVKYLNNVLKDSMLFAIQDKCLKYVGSDLIDRKFVLLNKERKAAVAGFFKEQGEANRVKIGEERNIIPYNGFSIYKINYKGDLPEYLKRAYKKMNEFDDDPPRKKLKKERKESNNKL